MTSPARSYRGVSAPERTAVRREQLLDAGLDLLGTVGHDRTTMTAICGHAKLTERYFYESFSSRQDLLTAVVDRIALELRTSALTALQSTPGDPEARVRAAVMGFVDVLTADPRKGRAGLIETSSADYLRHLRRQWLHDFATLIIEQAKSLYGPETLPEPYDRIGAVMFVGACTESIAAYLGGDIEVTTEQIVDSAVHLFSSSMHT